MEVPYEKPRYLGLSQTSQMSLASGNRVYMSRVSELKTQANSLVWKWALQRMQQFMIKTILIVRIPFLPYTLPTGKKLFLHKQANIRFLLIEAEL